MKLYETITKENWIKGVQRHPDDDVGCLMWHVRRLYGKQGDAAIVSAIKVLYPERLEPNPSRRSAIICLNDHHRTTLDDVLRVCKFADR